MISHIEKACDSESVSLNDPMTTTRYFFHPFLTLLVWPLLELAGSGAECHIEYDRSGLVTLSWPSKAGETYVLESAPDLSSIGWQVVGSKRLQLAARTNLIVWQEPAADTARFYRILKLDTAAPQIARREPIAGSFAVPLEASIKTWLTDDSGIEPASLRFQIGTNAPIDLRNPRLIYTNNVLTYTPLAGESLGRYGQSLTVTLAASDRVGNRGTNRWDYRLEMPAEVSDKVVVVDGGGTASSNQLTLVSQVGDTLTYQYSGLSSGLTAGMHLVDGTPGKSYARTILAVQEDRLRRTVIVRTEPASLARLIRAGSLSSLNFTRQSKGLSASAAGGMNQDFDFSYLLPLARVLYDKTGLGGSVRVEVLQGSFIELDAGMGFEAVFKDSLLQEFQSYVSGRMDLRLEVQARADAAQHLEGTVPLLSPAVRKSYVAMIGSLPVVVETVLEFDLSYSIDLPGSGHFQAGLTASKGILMGQRYQQTQWLDVSQYTPVEFQPLTPNWQAGGRFAAQLKVTPKLTLNIYGRSGLSAELDPHMEFSGQSQLTTRNFDWDLDAGLDAAMSSQEWVMDDLSLRSNFNRSYTLSAKAVVGTGSSQIKGPTIQYPPQNATRNRGEGITFTVNATGSMPVTYRWQRNGLDLVDGGRISGSAARTLVLDKLELADAGDYRVVLSNAGGTAVSDAATLTITDSLALIQDRYFEMGADEDYGTNTVPVHSVYLDTFYMDKYEVTKGLWDQVYQWATNHGYEFANVGSGKAANHPVQSITWHDALKWCNARSEMERRVAVYYVVTNDALAIYRNGLPDPLAGDPLVDWSASGYRLPTEAEWEKAAASWTGQPFPWGYYIDHDHANYWSYWVNGHPFYECDASLTEGTHPTYSTGEEPHTSPVGSFAPNLYGLYDVVGNVAEMCWDHWGYYGPDDEVNPHRPAYLDVSDTKAVRGGHYGATAVACRPKWRSFQFTLSKNQFTGFRCALPNRAANIFAPNDYGMVPIPDGSFIMGDTFAEGDAHEIPTHTVHVSAFNMDRYEVYRTLWHTFYNSASTYGYSFAYEPVYGVSSNAPVHVNWYDAVKWCNLRSQVEGRRPVYYTDAALTVVYKTGQIAPYVDWIAHGYRLPTEAEWERAARGGVDGVRFPRGDTITHSAANYNSDPSFPYDTSPTRGCHPTYHCAFSPVGSFEPNKYGLYDMAGNDREWCWDWYQPYPGTTQQNPHGPSVGLQRLVRGGSSVDYADKCRVASRDTAFPDGGAGFRCVRPQ